MKRWVCSFVISLSCSGILACAASESTAVSETRRLQVAILRMSYDGPLDRASLLRLINEYTDQTLRNPSPTLKFDGPEGVEAESFLLSQGAGPAVIAAVRLLAIQEVALSADARQAIRACSAKTQRSQIKYVCALALNEAPLLNAAMRDERLDLAERLDAAGRLCQLGSPDLGALASLIGAVQRKVESREDEGLATSLVRFYALLEAVPDGPKIRESIARRVGTRTDSPVKRGP